MNGQTQFLIESVCQILGLFLFFLAQFPSFSACDLQINRKTLFRIFYAAFSSRFRKKSMLKKKTLNYRRKKSSGPLVF